MLPTPEDPGSKLRHQQFKMPTVLLERKYETEQKMANFKNKSFEISRTPTYVIFASEQTRQASSSQF